MNDSPRARERLDGIRRRDLAFRSALAVASLPVPLLLALVAFQLAVNAFGPADPAMPVLPLLRGTLAMALVATLLAAPVALAGALASRRALSDRSRGRLEVVLSGLSAMPMVALGFLFARIVGPALALHLGLPALGPGLASAALACGLLPVLWKRLSAALDDVPGDLSRGALALGARPLQVLLNIDLPAALPRILRAVAEGTARAAGESVVVLMVSGNARTIWGGVDGGATLGQSLLVLLPEAQPGTPPWVEVHRIALVLLVVCVGLHVLGGAARRGSPS